MKNTTLKKRHPILNSEEKNLSQDIEAGHYISVPDVDTEVTRYTSLFRSQMKKNKSVTLRIADQDLENIKKRAEQIGVPYQTLIGALIHQFANKKIELHL
jgi:predicted DNA binding CopG/RHH family protein